MKIRGYATVPATDAVHVLAGGHGTTSIVRTGDDPNSDNFHITGIVAERADFLRRLSVAASDAADQLTAGVRP